MIAQAKLREHASLFDRMACTLGLDLQEEAVSGHLPFDEIAEAVLRCSRCGAEGACRKWLDIARTGAGAEDGEAPADCGSEAAGAAPDFCRNRDLLAYLKEPEV